MEQRLCVILHCHDHWLQLAPTSLLKREVEIQQITVHDNSISSGGGTYILWLCKELSHFWLQLSNFVWWYKPDQQQWIGAWMCGCGCFELLSFNLSIYHQLRSMIHTMISITPQFTFTTLLCEMLLWKQIHEGIICRERERERDRDV